MIVDHLSPSQVALLNRRYAYSCPRKWGYIYQLGLERKPSPAIEAGNRWEESVMTLLREGKEGIRDLVGDAQRVAISKMSDSLALYGVELGAESLVQKELEGEISGIRVVGRPDFVDREGVIVDIKWSSRQRDPSGWIEWTRPKELQVTAYYLLMQQCLPSLQPPKRGLLLIGYPQGAYIHAFSITSSMISQVKEDVVEAMREIEDGLRARPSGQCAYCDFADRCANDERAVGVKFQEIQKLATNPDW